MPAASDTKAQRVPGPPLPDSVLSPAETTPGEARAHQLRILAWLLLTVSAVAAAVAVVAAGPFFSNDPAHHLAGWEIARQARVDAVPNVAILQPISSRGFDVVYGFFRRFSGADGAWAATHVSMVLALGAAFAVAVRARGGRLTAASGVGFSLALAAPLCMGF